MPLANWSSEAPTTPSARCLSRSGTLWWATMPRSSARTHTLRLRGDCVTLPPPSLDVVFRGNVTKAKSESLFAGSKTRIPARKSSTGVPVSPLCRKFRAQEWRSTTCGTRWFCARFDGENQGDNRRKKLGGTLASVVTGMCWGDSRFGWFLVGNGEIR
jgi:hypothetical protein